MTGTLKTATDFDPLCEIQDYLKQGKLDAAETACMQFMKDSPGNAEAYFQLSLVCMHRKEWQKMHELLLKAVHLNPHSAIYHANIGTALHMQGKNPEAIRSYQQALTLDPDNLNSLNNLAVLYSLTDKNDEAEKLLKHSLELDPDQPEAWLNLCSAVQNMDFREEDVVSYARKAVALRPRSPEPYLFLGKALLRKGDPDAALESMNIALLLDEQNPDIHYRIGICHLQMERIPEAIQAFQSALTLDPRHADTYYTLAEFLYRLEDFPAAEEACRNAYEVVSDKLLPEILLSKILFVSGKYAEARKFYEQSFHHQTGILPADKKFLVAPVEAVDAWAEKHGTPCKEILPERIWQTADPVIFGSIPEGLHLAPAVIPHAYVAEISQAVIVPGHEVILVDHEKIALYDRLVHMRDWHSLREDEIVPLISDDHILVDVAPKSKMKIKEGIFLMSEAWYNYAHWLSEQVPRLYLIDQMREYEGIPLLVNDGLYPQQIESLKLVSGGKNPIKILPRDSTYLVDRLICPSILNAFNKRRYRPTEKATPADGPFHPEAIHFLRDRLLPQCRDSGGARKRLWISRKNQIKTGQRRLLNEPELEALFVEHGFEVVYPEAMSLMEQVELFAQAEMIAGPGGSAFMNIVFSPPGTRILILTKNHPQVNFHYFTNIAQIIGQSIAYVCGDSLKNMGVLGFETDFIVDTSAVRQAMKSFLDA